MRKISKQEKQTVGTKTRHIHRVFTSILSFFLILSMLPLVSLASDVATDASDLKVDVLDESATTPEDTSQASDEDEGEEQEQEQEQEPAKTALELTPQAVIAGNGYTFDSDTGTLTITDSAGMNQWSSDVRIDADPAARKRAIVHLIVGSGITLVPEQTFRACENLLTVNLPEGLTILDKFAFGYCPLLTTVALPTTLTNIEEQAFAHCPQLAQIVFPASLKKLGRQAFWESLQISTLDLSPCINLTTINDGVFRACPNLTKVILPEGMKVTGNSMFQDCPLLTDIIFPTTLQEIGSASFNGCRALAKVDIPEGVFRIREFAFVDCPQLTTIKFPSTLSSLHNSPFLNSGLTVADLSPCASLTTLDFGAFSGCASLVEVRFPQSLTKIERGTFGNTPLARLYFASTSAPIFAGNSFTDIPASGTVYYPTGGSNYNASYFNVGADSGQFTGWFFTAVDLTSPILTAGAVSRSSHTDATVKFTSDEAGQYYYAFVASGAAQPTIITTAAGVVCDTTTQTITLTNLTAGAQDIYIVVKDAAGNVSAGSFHSVIPAYQPPTYLFTITAAPGGSVDDHVEGPYEQGESIALTAIPANGYHFTHWTTTAGTVANSSVAQTSFTMPSSAATATAHFAPNPVLVLAAIADDSVAEGASYVKEITYTYENGSGTLRFSALGLPQGLAINATTGVISGSLADTGSFTVTVSVTDGSLTDTKTYLLSVGVAYPVIEHFGIYAGKGEVRARIDGNRVKFVRLLSGAKVIDPGSYSVSEGSTVITLREAYLSTYPVGTHTFIAEFSDGRSDSITLIITAKSIVSPQQPPASPQQPPVQPSSASSLPATGDSPLLPTLALLFAVASVALLAPVASRKRKATR